MNPEEKKLLEETRALVQDNHRMLRAIRREQWISFVAKLVIWTIVLLVPIYLYQYYFEPFISSFVPSGAASTTPGFFGLPSVDFQKLLNSYRGN